MAQEGTLQTTRRTFEVLETIMELERARLTDIAEMTGLAHSTVHSHLHTLESMGYLVERDDGYELGLRFLKLGELSRRSRDVFDIARPKVDELARKTGELVNLWVEESGKVVYMYYQQDERSIPFADTPGARTHLHCTASGKCLLAYMDDERIEEILDRHGLPARTDNTITDRAALFDELDQIRDQGYAFDDEEFIQGSQCIAVPVRASDGTPVCAISVSGPQRRISDNAEEYIDELSKMANVVELTYASQ